MNTKSGIIYAKIRIIRMPNVDFSTYCRVRLFQICNKNNYCINGNHFAFELVASVSARKRECISEPWILE